MLAIKLQRIGRKHQPSYRLVVAEARSKMAAPPVEDLGSYHPKTKATAFKKDRISYWLGIGAQPTVSAHNLLVTQGVVSTSKKAVKMAKVVVAEAPAAPEVKPEAKPEAAAKEEAVAEEVKEEATPAVEAPAAESAPTVEA